MSLIQRIRDKATWIVFGTIALALTAFILQDAFSGRGSSVGNSTTVGKVNGRIIPREDFEYKVDFYQKANAGQAGREQLIGNVWDYTVSQYILEEAYEELGIKVTGKELSDILFGSNPPQWMQQAFINPQTGEFDANLARQQFAEMKKRADDPQVTQIYEGYIQPTIDQTLREKYQALLTTAVYIPKWMAEKVNTDASSIARVFYVSVPYTTITDSAVQVTDNDIDAYVKANRERFERDEETRIISYVAFNAAATSSDSAQIFTEMEQLKNEFASSTDEEAFLNNKGSEMPYYGSYISQNNMQQSVNDSLFQLLPGQIYGPYVDGTNIVLAKMVGKTQIPDSASVRHILVATHQQDQAGGLMRVRDDSSAYRRLDSAVNAIKAGASFDSITSVYSDDPGSKNMGGVYENFTSGRMDQSFNDFAFTGRPGETKIVKTNYGFHYVQILDQKGSKPGYKIAYLAKPIISSSETVNNANTAASQFAANSSNKKEFEDNATKMGKIPMLSQEFAENDFTINGVGQSRELVKWAFEGDLGDVSEPIEIDEQYYVAIISAIYTEGLPSANAARQNAESFVLNEKKAKIIIDTKLKGNTLEAIAKSANAAVEIADSISFNAFVISNVGNEPKMIGAAFNKQIQNKVSLPIAGNNAVFVLKGESISAVPSLAANTETQKAGLENMLKQQIGYRFMDFLIKASDIKDYRSKFY